MAWVRVVVAISEFEGLAWGVGWMRRGGKGVGQRVMEIGARRD